MRFLRSFGYAVAAFFIAGVTSCAVIFFMVLNSSKDDGQGGLAAPVGGFFVARIAAVVTFIVSVVRGSPSRQKGADHCSK
jgi:hypothetical protein